MIIRKQNKNPDFVIDNTDDWQYFNRKIALKTMLEIDLHAIRNNFKLTKERALSKVNKMTTSKVSSIKKERKMMRCAKISS